MRVLERAQQSQRVPEPGEAYTGRRKGHGTLDQGHFAEPVYFMDHTAPLICDYLNKDGGGS